MADFTITSLRGGQNDTDPPTALAEDQVVRARNVEFNRSTLGERRRGATAIDIDGETLVTEGAGVIEADRVTFIFRHLPTNDESGSELIALSVYDGIAISWIRKDEQGWHVILPNDSAFGFASLDDLYKINALSLHGKLFLAFNNTGNRLQVWDGTDWRSTGLAEPAAPTGANTGSGSFSGTRYYRVRYTVQDGDGNTLRRSEPSEALAFSPSGSGTGVVVTKPASIGEEETHWELEASIDNANFYRIATTVVGTTTVTDSVAYTTGYAASGTLSEDIGDYSLIPSGQYLAADEDRLLIGGIFGETEAETEQLASRVMWTPVFGDPGVGNDERIPIDTDNFLDLDGFEGGPLTGLSTAANGYIYAFKRSHIYKLVRTGQRTKAYEAFPITKTRGAIPGSIVDGVDEAGRPAIFFLDPRVGPCMIGPNGLQTCGADILETFQTINQNASVVSVSLFYPEARQVHWWIATDDSDTPNLRLVLQTNEMRLTNEGYRRGWTVWDGPSAETVSACLYAENVDDTGDPRSLNLVPFIAKLDDDGLIQRTDTGDDDNGTEYEAHIRTKPYLPEGTLNRCGIMSGALIAKAQAGASLDVIVTRDFGLEQVSVSVPLDPASSETHVIKTLDNLSLSEARAVQIEFIDPATPGARWELTQLALRERREQSA